ncbi:hypothetical protein NU688_25470 [Variovorax sp. ZS18.2.2]|uniref:hypothetical protein n=1 Tax=Variovorax sp. ZS18.2.2 TaxID=2971255 RepID=UPI0021515619|nr:hypothetical protein [Variovorax sp. ZS18.2.2]MCR6479534.1 hypothetical protein [Variovorax sp. ZS18.2.2]
MFQYIRKAKFRLSLFGLAISTSALLVGCGPEAPPCNDPQRIEAVLRMVAKGHDEDLGNYKLKTADTVSLEAGTPVVTSYDESIKRRSCEVHLTFAFKPAVVQKMNFFMDWMGNPLGSALKYGIPPELYWNIDRPQQSQMDATVIRVVTGDKVSEAPLQLSVAYKIVKDEGANTFSTSVSYSTATTTPYLKVASNALAFDEHVRNVLKARGKAIPSSMQYGQPAASSAGSLPATSALTPASAAAQPVAAAPVAPPTAAEQAEQARLQKAADMIAAGNPQRGVDASASVPPASATPASGGPENLMSLITKYEPCGEEAVCLHTGKGNTVWMQAGQMRRMDYALLDRAISSKTPVCLRELTRTEGKNFAAESLDSQC